MLVEENSVGGPGKVMENSVRVKYAPSDRNSVREKYDWRRMENSVGGPGKVMENSVREKYAPSDRNSVREKYD